MGKGIRERKKKQINSNDDKIEIEEDQQKGQKQQQKQQQGKQVPGLKKSKKIFKQKKIDPENAMEIEPKKAFKAIIQKQKIKEQQVQKKIEMDSSNFKKFQSLFKDQVKEQLAQAKQIPSKQRRLQKKLQKNKKKNFANFLTSMEQQSKTQNAVPMVQEKVKPVQTQNSKQKQTKQNKQKEQKKNQDIQDFQNVLKFPIFLQNPVETVKQHLMQKQSQTNL